MDKLNERILAILKDDARTPSGEIATMLGASEALRRR